jgi:hypothetical protein
MPAFPSAPPTAGRENLKNACRSFYFSLFAAVFFSFPLLSLSIYFYLHAHTLLWSNFFPDSFSFFSLI